MDFPKIKSPHIMTVSWIISFNQIFLRNFIVCHFYDVLLVLIATYKHKTKHCNKVDRKAHYNLLQWTQWTYWKMWCGYKWIGWKIYAWDLLPCEWRWKWPYPLCVWYRINWCWRWNVGFSICKDHTVFRLTIMMGGGSGGDNNSDTATDETETKLGQNSQGQS